MRMKTKMITRKEEIPITEIKTLIPQACRY